MTVTRHFNKFLFVLLTLFIIQFRSEAQFRIQNTGEIAKIKDGTTYVIMKDPDDEETKKYADVYNKYWTFSKIKFIKGSEVHKYITPESSFLSISGKHTMYEQTRQNGTTHEFETIHVYLELWTCKDSYFKHTDRTFTHDDEEQVATVELYVDWTILNEPSLLGSLSYSGDGHIYNWSPGMLKNDIQQLIVYLEAAKKQSPNEEVVNKEELKNLKNGTLLVPEYVLVKYTRATGIVPQRADPKEILGDYQFNYKVMTPDQLDDKILNSKTPVYYLMYIYVSGNKLMNVVNSATGEIVYSEHGGMSLGIKPGDIKDLYKKVSKL